MEGNGGQREQVLQHQHLTSDSNGDTSTNTFYQIPVQYWDSNSSGHSGPPSSTGAIMDDEDEDDPLQTNKQNTNNNSGSFGNNNIADLTELDDESLFPKDLNESDYQENGNDEESDSAVRNIASPDLAYFDFLTNNNGQDTHSNKLSSEVSGEEVRSDKAVAGVVGLRNIGNTCFMNSGLQCLFGTTPIVDFFSHYFPCKGVESKESREELSHAFAHLANDVWQGGYEVIRPKNFKDTLSNKNSLFVGNLQHDSQEFLAILLDALHEELRVSHQNGKYPSHGSSDCGTSMELHTSHSKDKSSSIPLKAWNPKSSSKVSPWRGNNDQSVDTFAYSKGFNSVIYPSATQDTHGDGSESRESASPRSYDSHSSTDDKVSKRIRHMPIPPTVKNFKDYSRFTKEEMDSMTNCHVRDAMDDENVRASPNEEDDDTMDSNASSSNNQPTSNLIAPDELKNNSIHAASVITLPKSKEYDAEEDNNKTSCSNEMKFQDYVKDNKTLNVNVLAENHSGYDGQMNNEINFDSEKFSKVNEKTRPRETIDNLIFGNSDHFNQEEFCTKSSNPDLSLDHVCKLETALCSSKRVKETNLDCGNNDGLECQLGQVDGISCNGNKRIRLESLEKEKNLNMELERQETSKMFEDQDEIEDLNQHDNVTDTGSIDQEIDQVVHGASALPDSPSCTHPSGLKDAVDADKYWEKYLSDNDTIVARTFQGLFKNTVICSTCHFTSVTFEPFMYLSVPLPDAMKRQVEVTVVTVHFPVTCYLLEMSQADNVNHLKTKLCENLRTGYPDIDFSTNGLQMVEVNDCHISRTLEDWNLLRYIEENRNIYAIQILKKDVDEKEEIGNTDFDENQNQFLIRGENQFLFSGNAHCDAENKQEIHSEPFIGPSLPSDVGEAPNIMDDDEELSLSIEIDKDCDELGDQAVPEASQDSCGGQSSPRPLPPPPPPLPCQSEASKMSMSLNIQFASVSSCVICMEDLPIDQLKQHTACPCVMCGPCLDRTIDHHASNVEEKTPLGQIRCPGCRENADPSLEFVSVDQVGKAKPKLRYFTLPVLMRHEKPSEKSNHDTSNVTLFGFPFLVHVSNQITGRQLHNLIQPLLRIKNGFRLVLVDAQGSRCSRCLFSQRCQGCIDISGDSDEIILLQSSDNIAISYSSMHLENLKEECKPLMHESMNMKRLREKLDLEECLRAFSEKETLDENNPWYCQNCRKSQCATKTLTVWKFPDFLIIYLKRFVFVNGQSVKLEMPVNFRLHNLDLTPFMTGPLQQPEQQPLFDLYACVNHYGSVGGGHYTAYCRHASTATWNYFDDSCVSKDKPPSGNEPAAYILFYERKGISQRNRPS